jgi:glycosyltransferase involved in cell wall biosynthesis
MTQIPRIDPVQGGPRPLWSVMIPAYEGADYLERTIRSVLAQDPGAALMQIEVVDDHSVKEDLRAVVERIGQGRVDYYKKPQNAGVVANFNTCLERSRGRWVHVLHSDDLVLPGFYARLSEATKVPGLGAAFCRFFFMDEEDHWTCISALEAKSPGVFSNWIERIAVECRIQAPAIVVCRQTYEEIGGFDPRLAHCADWDMWKRIASAYPVWYEPAVLASYRTHLKSDTSRLMRTGANVRDMRRSIEYSQAYLPATATARLSWRARRSCACYALNTAGGMLGKGDIRAAAAQTREALSASCSPLVMVRLAKTILKHGGSCLLSLERATQS